MAWQTLDADQPGDLRRAAAAAETYIRAGPTSPALISSVFNVDGSCPRTRARTGWQVLWPSLAPTNRVRPRPKQDPESDADLSSQSGVAGDYPWMVRLAQLA